MTRDLVGALALPAVDMMAVVVIMMMMAICIEDYRTDRSGVRSDMNQTCGRMPAIPRHPLSCRRLS
jgi:hypothetical protein